MTCLPSRLRLSAILLLLILTPAHLHAGVEDDRFAFAPSTTPQALLADQLVLRARNVLTVDPHRGRAMLDHAAKLQPDDAEIARLCIEAAQLAGDDAGYRNAIRRYLAIAPRDDAAQLDLLLSFIRERQTIEQRAAAADGVLTGRGADRLSAPLRSRLHSYIAVAFHESGQGAAATPHLKRAVRLDPANPQAARLTVELVHAADAGATSEGLALVALLRAAPFDPSVHIALGRTLAAMGRADEAAIQLAAAQAMGVAADPAPAGNGAGYQPILDALGKLEPDLAAPQPVKRPPLSLTVNLPHARYRYLDPIVATVTLRNMTEAPLAVGDVGSLPATLLLVARPEDTDPPPPIVVDLRRRIRLDPHQAVTVDVPIHRGEIGNRLSMQPTAEIDLAVSAVLNPRIADDGSVMVPPIGALAAARPIQRRGLPATDANLAMWIQTVTDQPPTHADTLTAAARLCRLIANGQIAESNHARIAAALVDLYARTDTTGRAWLACFHPEGHLPNLRAQIDAETDPLIALCR